MSNNMNANFINKFIMNSSNNDSNNISNQNNNNNNNNHCCNNNNPLQWNLWQQFQWSSDHNINQTPPLQSQNPSSNHKSQNQNRWSKLVSNLCAIFLEVLLCFFLACLFHF